MIDEPVKIDGRCDPRFAPVAAAFERNFAERGDVGAAVAVHWDGELVVDLWGGLADAVEGRPWDRDTLSLVFSTTKGLTAMCALLLWQRGELDIDAPVTEVWPEFAAEGKEKVTTRHLLAHRAGLPVIEDPITVAECHDHDVVAARLAGQRPRWEPGTAHGYHALTYGWLVGEVVRRVAGRSVGGILAEEICGPLGVDAYLGLPADLESRVSTLLTMDLNKVIEQGLDEKQMAIGMQILDPNSLTFKVFSNPSLGDVADFNSRAMHAAEWPAVSGIATARGLATLYAELAHDRLLDASTLDAATTVQSRGRDEVLVVDTAFGLGFQLPSDLAAFGPNGRGFGHDGAGGSVAFADRETGLALSYVMNQMGAAVGYDGRGDSLIRAAYASLGEGA